MNNNNEKSRNKYLIINIIPRIMWRQQLCHSRASMQRLYCHIVLCNARNVTPMHHDCCPQCARQANENVFARGYKWIQDLPLRDVPVHQIIEVVL